MSEDLRDDYKNSRQFSQQKPTGSTYRKKLESKKCKQNHLIKLGNHAQGRPQDYASLDDLNVNYGLNKSNLEYSLNKKKRWEIGDILSQNMNNFKEESLDIRFFETVQRKSRTKPNLINIERSKGKKVNVKNTYADLNSILAKERKDLIEKLNPTQKEAKVNRFKSKNTSASVTKSNRIIIHDNQADSDSDSDNGDNIEYEIKYDETQEHYTKYGHDYFNEKIRNKKTFLNRYYSVSDDETLKRNLSQMQHENKELSDEHSGKTENIEVTLNDLIENFSKILIKKHDLKQKSKQKSKPLNEMVADSTKSQKIYIERQMSRRTDANTAGILLPKFCMPIRTSFQLTKSTVEIEKLKETFGMKYNEADECWPRRFNLNISDDLKQSFDNKKLDLTVWLRFQESGSVEDTCFCDVSICANLVNCESIAIENINPCDTHTLEFIVQKAVEMIRSLPEEFFKTEEVLKLKTVDNFNATIGDLLDIANYQNEAKNLEELKLEFINNHKIQVVKEDTNEKEKQLCLDNNEKMECVLCFEEKSIRAECTLLKKCGHCVCNECFQFYCESRLSNTLANAGRFPCPSCDNELETALLINFASNANLLELYLKLSVEKVLFVLNDYKWCPSANCSKILKVDLITNPFGTISCKCGYKMCLRCNNPPHFPAKCKQIANYYKELNKTMNTTSIYTHVQETSYSGKGKRCPRCFIFMEKNMGCNQMVCSLCNCVYCWNCLKEWSAHLKLNEGQHACKMKETMNLIEIEFVGKSKRNNLKAEKKKFEDSVYHRQMRLSISQRQYTYLQENLIKTIDFESMLGQTTTKSKTVSNDRNKQINEKRNEIRNDLKDIVSFLNELHFICEHGFVLIRDKDLASEARRSISNILKSIEVIIWRINYNLEYCTGMDAVDQIRKLHQHGIKCIRSLNNIGK